MSLTPQCPDEKTIEQLIDGQVSPELEKQLAEHFDKCAACRRRLDQISDLGAIVEKQAPVTSVTVVSTTSDTFADKLDALRSARPAAGSTLTSGYADVLPWLAETEDGIGVIDDFVLTSFIGRGGMGLVFKALDRKLQRTVAIKLMSPGLLADSQASERFLREARSAASINHVNVVTVHSVDQIRGLPFLVMEFVAGKSLDEHVRSGVAVPATEVLKIARQTALGLAAAHKNGITHRDIKPSNLMLDRKAGRIKIADFGLASTLNDTSLTRSGTMVGTPDFASPEQVNAGAVDARSDLFSLGSVLFHLSTGRLPFQAESLVGTFDAIRNHELPRIDRLNKQAPPFLADIIQKLMQKAPNDRFQSAEELLAAINSHGTRPLSRLSLQIDTPEKNSSPRKSPTAVVAISIGAAVFSVAALLVVLLFDPFGFRDGGPDVAGDGPSQHSAGSGDLREDDYDDEEPRNENRVPGDEGGPEQVEGIFAGDAVELVAAMNEPGDLLIELAAGEVFRLEESLIIDGRSVTITGDPEDRPVIEAGSFSVRSLFDITGGALVLEGVRIQDDSELMSAFPLIAAEAGSVEILNSAIVSASRDRCVLLDESRLKLESSVFVSDHTGVVVHSSDEQAVEVYDSAVVAPTPFVIEESAFFNLAARDTLFSGWNLIEIESEEAGDFRIEVGAVHCSFNVGEALVGLRIDTPESYSLDPSEIGARFEWNATECDLPGKLMILYSEEEDEEQLVSWSQAEVEVGSGSEFVEIEGELMIDDWIENCLEDRIETVEQVRSMIEGG